MFIEYYFKISTFTFFFLQLWKDNTSTPVHPRLVLEQEEGSKDV